MPPQISAFQFPTRKSKGARPKNIFPSSKIAIKAEPVVMTVHGVTVDSKEEYWVGLALDKLGLRYDYQVPVEGGSSRRGGNVVDFLVYTPGQLTMLDPMGRHWHTGKHEDRFQMERVARKKHWRLIAWFTDQVTSAEATLVFLRSKLPT